MPSVSASKIINFFAKNFNMGVNDSPSHATNTCFFQNPLFIEECDVPNKLQPELSELQHDTILHSSCNQEALFCFFSSILQARMEQSV